MSVLALRSSTITTALTGDVTSAVIPVGRVEGLTLYATFTYGSGGTTAKAWVQTTLDGGVTWVDIANFAFTTSTASRAYNLTGAAVTSIATPTDGSLADNTSVNGLLGEQFRVKVTTTGTYAGSTTLAIYAIPK